MISIITPAYNRARLIPRMIESVLNQTLSEWELLIMDDGSTDDTAEVVQKFRDSRIKFFQSVNSGAADKRNKGVEKASGDFVVFLDSDDEVKIDWLENLWKEVKTHNGLVVSCGYNRIDTSKDSIKTILPKKLGGLFGDLELNFLAGTLLMKKELFEEAGGYDPLLRAGQHTDLVIRLSKIFETKKIQVLTVHKALVNIYVHGEERIRHDHNALYLGSLRMFEKHRKIFCQHPGEYYNYLSMAGVAGIRTQRISCLLYTSPSPRDRTRYRMPSSA